MDVTTMIDKQLEALRDKLYEMQLLLKRLENEADALYEKKLDMLVAGHSEDNINNYLIQEWEKILSSLSAIADSKKGGDEESC
ncbi:MAG: hypothetical protein QW561_04315 [Candidatus Aenigmatarchaeota archaeon]